MIARRALCAAAVMALALQLAGCATAQREPAADVTGGLTLKMYVKDADSAFELYGVQRDGLLSYGGGLDAMNGSYSWTGPMTGEEVRRLLALLDEHRWLEANPPSTGEPASRRYTITIRRGGAKRKFKLVGAGPAVQPVHDLLATAALRRNEAFIRTLPQPGEQR